MALFDLSRQAQSSCFMGPIYTKPTPSSIESSDNVLCPFVSCLQEAHVFWLFERGMPTDSLCLQATNLALILWSLCCVGLSTHRHNAQK
jgi:hypothetical protein